MAWRAHMDPVWMIAPPLSCMAFAAAPWRENPCIAHQHIEPAETPDSGICKRCTGRCLGDVTGEDVDLLTGRIDFASGSFQLAFVTPVDDNVGAFGDETRGGGFPYTRAAPRDRNHFAVETH